jgi:hypothetical protein
MNAADGDFDELASLLRSIPREFSAMTVGLNADQYALIARGPQFDIVAVETLLEEVGLAANWDYSSVFDLRTMMRLAELSTKDVSRPADWIAHNAYWDCRYQILCWAKANQRLLVRDTTPVA